MPLPLVLPAPIDGDLPVRSAADVRRQWPEEVQRSATAPVRDAKAEAFTSGFFVYQERASYAAAQSDATRATGKFLESFAAEVGIFPQAGEETEALRERLFATPDVVTPGAILAIANAILAPYTAVLPQLCESVLDRWFVFDGAVDNACHSFVGDGTVSLLPEYPDRRYDLRPQRSPTGALPFADHEGRMFILRVPDIGAAAGFATYADQGYAADLSLGGIGAAMFVSDGDPANLYGQSFVFPGMQTALSVYQQLANAVDRIAGHGVRWVLWVDEKLT